MATGGTTDGEVDADADADAVADLARRRLGATAQVATVVVVALAVRVLYLIEVVADRPAASDADQYLDIARHVARGDGVAMQWPQVEVHPTAFRPPAFPSVLGAWIWAFGDSIFVARLLNVVLGTAVVALTYVVVRRLGNHRGGLVAAAVVSVYPPLLANDATTLAEPLSLLLMLSVVHWSLRRQWLLAGLAGGALTLTKPAAQGFVALLVALVVLADRRRHRDGWRRPLLAAAAVGVGAAIVIAPWIVRNQVELGTTSIVTSNGFNLVAVYGDVARERGEFVDPATDPAYQSLGFRLLRFDEAAWNAELTEEGLRGIRSDPGYVARTTTRNVVRWLELSPAENEAPEVLDGRDRLFRRWTLPSFYVVTVAGLAGVVLAARRRLCSRMGLALLGLTGGYFTLTSLVTVAPPRLRAPFDLVCCIGVGLLVVWFTNRSSEPRTRTGPAATG